MNTSQAPNFRWGLVGAGRIGKSYVESASTLAGLAFSWLADPTLPAGPQFPAVLQEAPVDAVLVCTPPNSHFPLCVHLLSQRIPTLCEKPIAFTSAQAGELAALSAATATLFSQPAKFRGVPEVQEALRRIAAGTIGDLHSIQVSFAAPVDMSGRWNADPSVAGGGVLMDNGAHAIDLIRLFAGPLLAVKAAPGPAVQYLPVEDSVTLQARSHSGIIASVFLSWSHPSPGPDYLVLTGARGEIAIGWQSSRCNGEPFGGPYQKLPALGSQLAQFARQQPFLSPADAVANVAAIEAAYRSFHSGAWEPVA